MQITDPAAISADNQDLSQTIKRHVRNNGWHNTAKVLREVISTYISWASNFTELDSVLRRIENNFNNSCRPDLERDLLAQRERNRSGDHINLPDSKVSDHFS